jgi:hypothetical protein
MTVSHFKMRVLGSGDSITVIPDEMSCTATGQVSTHAIPFDEVRAIPLGFTGDTYAITMQVKDSEEISVVNLLAWFNAIIPETLIEITYSDFDELYSSGNNRYYMTDLNYTVEGGTDRALISFKLTNSWQKELIGTWTLEVTDSAVIKKYPIVDINIKKQFSEGNQAIMKVARNSDGEFPFATSVSNLPDTGFACIYFGSGGTKRIVFSGYIFAVEQQDEASADVTINEIADILHYQYISRVAIPRENAHLSVRVNRGSQIQTHVAAMIQHTNPTWTQHTSIELAEMNHYPGEPYKTIPNIRYRNCTVFKGLTEVLENNLGLNLWYERPNATFINNFKIYYGREDEISELTNGRRDWGLTKYNRISSSSSNFLSDASHVGVVGENNSYGIYPTSGTVYKLFIVKLEGVASSRDDSVTEQEHVNMWAERIYNLRNYIHERSQITIYLSDSINVTHNDYVWNLCEGDLISLNINGVVNQFVVQDVAISNDQVNVGIINGDVTRMKFLKNLMNDTGNVTAATKTNENVIGTGVLGV